MPQPSPIRVSLRPEFTHSQSKSRGYFRTLHEQEKDPPPSPLWLQAFKVRTYETDPDNHQPIAIWTLPSIHPSIAFPFHAPQTRKIALYVQIAIHPLQPCRTALRKVFYLDPSGGQDAQKFRRVLHTTYHISGVVCLSLEP